MKRLCIMLIALLLIFGMAMAEQLTPSEFLKSKSYAIYKVGGVEDIGLDASLFSGDNAGVSLCGCYYDHNDTLHSFFWREADGSVYVARCPMQALLGEVLSYTSSMQNFWDMCEQCGFSLGLYIDDGVFTFGMPEESPELLAMAKAIAAGRPMTYRVGWEAFIKSIMLPGMY